MVELEHTIIMNKCLKWDNIECSHDMEKKKITCKKCSLKVNYIAVSSLMSIISGLIYVIDTLTEGLITQPIGCNTLSVTSPGTPTPS